MQLLISCPQCNTSYQIDEDEVKKSDGQARCFNCQHVFNALTNSQPLTEDSNSRLNLPDSEDLYDSLPLSQYTQQLEQTDRELSSLFVPEEQSQILTGPDDTSLQETHPLLAEDLLDIDTDKLAPIEPLVIEKRTERKKYSATASISWIFFTLILLAVFIAQVAWINRADLLMNSQARNLIESACNINLFNCQLPARREPEKYQIVDRKVSAHPQVKGILSFSLLFQNTAAFSQPVPGITLSLFDSNRDLIAQRSFSYKDYVRPIQTIAPMVESGQTRTVSMNLEDPGTDVTGFEFNFY